MKSSVLWWLGVAATALLVLWLLSVGYGAWQMETLMVGTRVVDARYHTITFTQAFLTGAHGPFNTPWWLLPACLLLAAVACFGLSMRRRPADPMVDVKR